MEIKEVKISDLKMADYNPRIMPEHEMSALINSIREFGIVEPVVVNQDNTVIGGHQRLLACLQLGKRFIPVIYVDLPKQKEKVLNLALNRIHGVWDEQKLLGILKEIDLEGDGDFDLTGFEKIELHNLEDKFLEERPDADDVPEAPRVAKSKLGEIYQLGNHRLMCGDSTKRGGVGKLMDGKKADMVFTDPPYGVNYGADQDILNKKSGGKSKLTARPIIGDNLSAKELAEVLWRPSFHNLYDISKDDCSFYLTMCQGGDQMMMMMMMMMSEKWQIKHELIWVKSSPVFSMGRLDYDYQHEPILYGWKLSHNWYGKGKFLKSIWEIPKPSKSDLHPTMKPIALIENALLNSSKQNDNIIDLFGGSGSTLIACEQTNRICYMMEIEPIYCDVIIQRWEKFTGKQAELISQGCSK